MILPQVHISRFHTVQVQVFLNSWLVNSMDHYLGPILIRAPASNLIAEVTGTDKLSIVSAINIYINCLTGLVVVNSDVRP